MNSLITTEHGSEAFEKFLSLLGEKVTLQGWKGFDGELDVRSNIGLFRISRCR